MGSIQRGPAPRSDIDICFGGKTAIHILRAFASDGLVAVHVKENPALDRNAPVSQILRTIEQLETICPWLSVERPAYLFSRSEITVRKNSLREQHRITSSLGGGSFLKISDGMYVCSSALAFIQIAAGTDDFIQLAELASELCGTYSTETWGQHSSYDVVPLTSLGAIRQYIRKHPDLKGASRAERALRYAVEGSASPRETKAALLLGLPKAYGGYGFGMPQMNREVSLNEKAQASSGKRTVRCDLYWPGSRIDVEYQSREMHSGEQSRISDSVRTNALISMGWTVVEITNYELESPAAMDAIAAPIRRALKKSRQVRVSDYEHRQIELRRKLHLPIRWC